MGIFYDMTKVFNRAPVPITVRFDGQDTILQPGEAQLPSVSVSYAKNQNPIMGSADADNPHLSGADYLIGVVGKDNCAPLTKEQWEAHLGMPCRVNYDQFMEDRLGPKEHVEVKGKGRKTQAKGAFDGGVRMPSPQVEVDA
jgi:hypothetical protein